MSASVIIVGGGAGGLAAALDLAVRGFEVRVLERAASVGGKIRQVEVAGTPVDVGPTVLTMRWVLDELWAHAGASVDRDLTLVPLDPIARHFWSDGSSLDLHGDTEHTAAAITAFAGPREADGYRGFRRYARQIFDAVDRPFLRAQRPSVGSLLGTNLATLADLMRIDATRTLWAALGDYFRDRRLRQLFGRYATYAGSSPLRAPATLHVIAEVEQQGVYRVKGGMIAVAHALAALAARRGVEVSCGTEVSEVLVSGGRAVGVRLIGGETLLADAVIVNADVRAVAAGRFGSAVRRAAPGAERAERSSSALTWAVSARTSGVPLAHHDVFFSDDYEAETRALWDHRIVPDEPTIYCCAQDRISEIPPAGPERLFLLVNAPPDGDHHRPSGKEMESWTEATFQRLARMGLSIEPVEVPRTMSPADFEGLFPATGGALYGPASHGWRSAFAREGARTRIASLYFAGGAVHPGAGVPMAILSGRRAAEVASADLASTRRSPRRATLGTTWTSSATTASGRSS